MNAVVEGITFYAFSQREKFQEISKKEKLSPCIIYIHFFGQNAIPILLKDFELPIDVSFQYSFIHEFRTLQSLKILKSVSQKSEKEEIGTIQFLHSRNNRIVFRLIITSWGELELYQINETIDLSEKNENQLDQNNLNNLNNLNNDNNDITISNINKIIKNFEENKTEIIEIKENELKDEQSKESEQLQNSNQYIFSLTTSYRVSLKQTHRKIEKETLLKKEEVI